MLSTLSSRVSTENSAPSLAQYPSPIRPALRDLTHHTTIPLVGPIRVPRNLSATTVTTKSRYMVNLYQCRTITSKGSVRSVFPVNSAQIGNAPDCAGNADIYGSFGAQQFASSTQARTKVFQSSWMLGSTCYPHYADRQACGQAPPQIFHRQSWRLVFAPGTDQKAPGQSTWEQTVLRIWHDTPHHAAFTGVVLYIVQEAADGNHTEIIWNRGPTAYYIWIRWSVRQAITLFHEFQYTRA